MAESAVQSAVETLNYFLRQKDFYLSHVDVWVMSLRNKLKALLKDVDGMRGDNESVQVIEVANNTKNVIDSFIFKIAQQRGETSAGWMSYQSTFCSGIKDKPAIEDVGKKIFGIKSRLDEIILPIFPILPNRSQYGIHNIRARGEASTSSNQSQIQKVKRAPMVEEAEVVGRTTAVLSGEVQPPAQVSMPKEEVASKESRYPGPPSDPDLKISNSAGGKCVGVEIEVKILGWEAMIRIKCNKKNHPAARLMAALKELDLDVYYASVSVVNDLMIQQATIKMASRMYTHEQLSAALFARVA